VTSGFRWLQESKVDALGIRRFFCEIQIDAIDEEPPACRSPKTHNGVSRIPASFLSSFQKFILRVRAGANI